MIPSLRLLTVFVATAGWSSMLQAQTLGHGPDDQIVWWRVALALIFCLMLAVGAAFVIKARTSGQLAMPRFINPGRTSPARRLELVETLRLKPQLDLVIVRCDGRDLLLATHAQTAQLIERLGPEQG